MLTHPLPRRCLALAISSVLLCTSVAAVAAPPVELIDTAIETYAYGENGIASLAGETISARRVDVTTHGGNAAALLANGTGSSITHDGGVLRSDGSQRSATGAPLQATVMAQNNAHIDLRNVMVENAYLGGPGGSIPDHPQGYAVVAEGGSVRIQDSSIRARDGVWAVAGGQAVLHDTAVEALGGKAVLVDEGATLVMNGGSIVVQQSLATVGKSNSFATGVYAVDRGRASLTDTSIEVHHQGGEGVRAFLPGAHVDLLRSSVLMTTQDAVGVRAFSDGTVALRDSQVLATGQDAHAALIEYGAVVSAANTVLETTHGSAVRLDGGHIVLTEGSQVRGGNGIAVELDTDDLSSVMLDRGSSLMGDIRFGERAFDADGNDVLDPTIAVSIGQDSRWRGASDIVGTLTLTQGGHWDMTEASTVAQLSVSNSSISFNHGDGAFKTLTVNGDYAGDNALLQMNTVLGDDASSTDRLHVRGNTSGQTLIEVTNVGGQGAESQNGIALVVVDGRSDGQFALAGRAVGGAHEYFLHHGSSASQNDGNWYLRSSLAVEPPVDPGTDPVDPIVDPIIDPIVDPIIDPIIDPVAPPIYRPEVGAYLGNQSAATGLFAHGMHQRMGGQNLSMRLESDGRLGAAWARAGSAQSRARLASGQLEVRNESNVLQVGTDLVRWGSNSRGVAGVMAATGKASSHSRSSITGYGADGEVKGQALGAYASWFQHPAEAEGAYVDGWVQAARFNNRVQGDAVATERYDSRTLSGSVEAGYAFKVHAGARNAVFVEPQVQLTYTDHAMDGGQHVERNGTQVVSRRAGGLETRVGVRAFGHATTGEGNRIQPFVAANWIHAPAAGNAMAFNNEVIAGGQPQDAYELKGGVQLQMGRGWTGWGELGAAQGAGGYRNRGIQLGMKYSW